jgi:hypothetical protein
VDPPAGAGHLVKVMLDHLRDHLGDLDLLV